MYGQDPLGYIILGGSNSSAATIDFNGGSSITETGKATYHASFQLGGHSTLTVVEFASAELEGRSGFTIGSVHHKHNASAGFSGRSAIAADGEVILSGYHNFQSGSGLLVDDRGAFVLYSNVEKSVMFKVYDKASRFMTTWNPRTEVVNSPSIKEQINSAGSEVIIELARPADEFGEGVDVTYGNRVEIIVADKDAPNGLTMFIGKITKYKPDYVNEKITVTLLGYGYDASQYIIEAGEDTEQDHAIGGSQAGFGHAMYGDVLIHRFTTMTQAFKLARLNYKLKGGLYPIPAADPKDAPTYMPLTGHTVTMYLFTTEADARANTNSIASASVQIRSVEFEDYAFGFGTALSKLPNTAYFARFVASNTLTGVTEPYTTYMLTGPSELGYSLHRRENDKAGGWIDQLKSPVFTTYKTTGSTLATFNSVSPSYILKQVIDDLRSRGCNLIYTETSIDETNTVVSYEFNTETGQAAIDKVLELCPKDWYYYIDQTVFPAVIHLHKKTEIASHTFMIGHDVTRLEIEKSVEPVKNVVYFTGDGIYKKYANQASIDKYGIKAIKVSDKRVTQMSTADIMANRSMVLTPEILVNLGVGDNGIERKLGYDIEAPRLGQMVKIGNTGTSASSKYDVAVFDTSPYDYDLADIGSIQFQITEKSYTLEELAMSLSTTPPDVSKRIADIKRNVDEITYGSNPATPTT